MRYEDFTNVLKIPANEDTLMLFNLFVDPNLKVADDSRIDFREYLIHALFPRKTIGIFSKNVKQKKM